MTADLYRLGKRRGVYEAVKGRGDNRTRASLGTSDLAEAERMLSDINHRILTGGKTGVAAILNLYRHYLGERYDRHAERSESCLLKWWKTHDIAEVKPRTCRAYADYRRGEGMSENTIRLELSYLSAAAKHAWQEEVIDRRPDMLIPTSDARRERWLEKQEFDLLYHCALEDHVQLYLLLAVVTGARPSHILALTWDQVDLERRLINFRKAGEKQTNKRKPIIPITETLADRLGVVRPLSRDNHVIEWRGRRVRSIKRGIEAAAARARIPDVTPYVLRHTAGTWMAMAGVPILEIAERLGHASIETTRRHYLHMQPSYLATSTAALDVGGKPRGLLT